jgi:hypothetical protein
MAAAALTGHGHPEVLALLPATVSADRVALVGLHAWATDDIANVTHWGIRSFSPAELRATTQPLLDWLAATGCARVAIHFDVDTIDSNEIVLGLGAEPGGLTAALSPQGVARSSCTASGSSPPPAATSRPTAPKTKTTATAAAAAHTQPLGPPRCGSTTSMAPILSLPPRHVG